MNKKIILAGIVALLSISMFDYCYSYSSSNATNQLINSAISKSVRDYEDLKSDLKKNCVKSFNLEKCKKYCDKAKDNKEGKSSELYKKYCKDALNKPQPEIVTTVPRIQPVVNSNIEVVNNLDGTKTEIEKLDNKEISITYDSSGKNISKKIVENFNNDDGTKTKTETIEAGGKIIKETREYDNSNNLIEEKLIEVTTETKEEYVISHKIFNSGLNNYNLKTEDGKEIGLLTGGGESGESKAVLNIKKNEVVIYNDSYNSEDLSVNKEKVKIKISENNFMLIAFGISIITKLPIVVESESGKIYIGNVKENSELKIMPNELESIIKDKKDLDIINTRELVIGDKVNYKLSGSKFQKILWFFPTEIQLELLYDAQTGDLVGMEKKLIDKLTDVISF